MGFPHVRYDSVQRRYAFEAHFSTRPNFRITVGGNISSTAFNQAYVGIDHQWIGRVGQRLNAELYLGPIYTWGALGGRTDFYLVKPVFLDYSYNFSVHNLRHGSFGNVTKIDNTEQVKESESFFSLSAGMPLTHRSVLMLRANAGHVNYRYDSDELFVDETDHTRFSFFGLKAEVARNTLDKFLYPAGVRTCAFRPSGSPGATNSGPTTPKGSSRAPGAGGSGPASRGTSTSTSPPAAGSRSGSISTASIRTTRISPPRARRSCRNPPMPRFRMRG